MRSLFESNKGGDCLGSYLVNQIDVMYNLYTLGVGAQITCNIYNVLKKQNKKNTYYTFMKFNQHYCLLDGYWHTRSQLNHEFIPSTNQRMDEIFKACNWLWSIWNVSLLHTYCKKGGVKWHQWEFSKGFLLRIWWILLTGIAILSRTLLVRRTVTITEPPINAYLKRVVRRRRGEWWTKPWMTWTTFHTFVCI